MSRPEPGFAQGVEGAGAPRVLGFPPFLSTAIAVFISARPSVPLRPSVNCEIRVPKFTVNAPSPVLLETGSQMNQVPALAP